MYKAPEGPPMPEEVKCYLAFTAKPRTRCDLDGWHIDEALAEQFRAHLHRLLPLAAAGNGWAQYYAGNLLLDGSLHSSRRSLETCYEAQATEGSTWLVRAARQGFVAAVDNLVTLGVGPEADRLRAITAAVEREESGLVAMVEGVPVVMPGLFERVWERAYGGAADERR